MASGAASGATLQDVIQAVIQVREESVYATFLAFLKVADLSKTLEHAQKSDHSKKWLQQLEEKLQVAKDHLKDCEDSQQTVKRNCYRMEFWPLCCSFECFRTEFWRLENLCMQIQAKVQQSLQK
jgi:hypothetical protein